MRKVPPGADGCSNSSLLSSGDPQAATKEPQALVRLCKTWRLPPLAPLLVPLRSAALLPPWTAAAVRAASVASTCAITTSSSNKGSSAAATPAPTNSSSS